MQVKSKLEIKHSSEQVSTTNKDIKFKTHKENNKNKNASKEDINRKLQSPVESHFALTPSTNSESSSPKNGFTSIEGTNLLQEELDQLIMTEMKQDSEMTCCVKGSISVDGLQSPTDENINMFVRTNNDPIRNIEKCDSFTEPVTENKENAPEVGYN